MSQPAPEPILLKDYRPPAFLIDTVDLKFELHPSKTTVTATSSFRRNPARAAMAETLLLDGEGLTLESIALDGAPLPEGSWSISEDSLEVRSPPEAFQLTVVTTIDPLSNKALEGLYMSSGRFCTQCEAEGFRRITYYLDRPDVLAQFKVTLVADKAAYPVLLSNGNCTEQGEIEEGKHYTVWEDPFPKPCYLFALVAGDLACVSGQFKTASDRSVALHIFVEHGKEKRAEYALDALIRSMRWDEVVYGLEYDLDVFNIVAVSDFNMGAMENKSLNIFNDKFILADPETATDTDYAWIESVVAHEYFHNWTGNRVTCRDWFQLSLKEGLTVFRDQQFSADQRSQSDQRIEDVKRLRAAQFTEDASPLAHPVRPDSYAEINNFYTHTVYEKGAEVVRMIHTLIGEENFRKGMDLYFERHDGQAVTCEDFVNAMETASGHDLSQFMLWYKQAGTPTIHAKGTFDPKQRKYVLELSQSCSPTPGQGVKKPMHIPVAIGFVDQALGSLNVSRKADERETSKSMETHVVSLKNQSATVIFEDFPENADRPIVSVNRGFSAPVVVKADRSDGDLGVLIARDPDPVSRWDAAQELALSVLRKRLKSEFYDTALDTLLRSMSAVLDTAQEDPGLTAQLLSLPVESAIAEGFKTYDPIAVYEARKWLQKQIGQNFLNQFATLLGSIKTAIPYDPCGSDANKRALKHQALAHMVTADYARYAVVAHDLYENSETMTARWSALQVLNTSAGDLRRAALNDFEKRFTADNLVMDKWFSLEATHPSMDTLQHVDRLKLHPKYDPKNPNKIRALIGSFASGNTVAFHQNSGEGYAFVADQVLEIDAFNPQAAARLAGVFQNWSRYDVPRKTLMHTELSRIANSTPLSQDVREIVGKALAAADV